MCEDQNESYVRSEREARTGLYGLSGSGVGMGGLWVTAVWYGIMIGGCCEKSAFEVNAGIGSIGWDCDNGGAGGCMG